MNKLRKILSYTIVRCSSLMSRGPIYESQGAGHGVQLAILLLLPVLLTGCRCYRAAGPAANYYYLNPDENLSAIGRVALVELDNDSPYPQISTDIAEALFQALQKKQIFSLTIVRQDCPAWHSLQLDVNSGLQTQNGGFASSPRCSLEQLSTIRKALNCDGILTGTITGYQPYPHMAVGLRLKLIDLKDGQLLWALEQIWDTADKTTEHRIKNYFQRQMRHGFAPLNEQLATVSPLRFIDFVAYEAAETIQQGH